MTEQKDNKEKQKTSKVTRILTIFFLIVFALELILGIHFLHIKGNSMTPGIKNGQLVMTTRLIGNNQRNYKRGDIITFNAYGVDPRCTDKQEKYIKRIIGVPGDKISFNGKTVYVNGKPEAEVIPEKFKTDESQSETVSLVQNGKDLDKWNLKTLSNRKIPGTNNYYWNQESIGVTTVPDGTYFVLGDHRSVSNDSREFGYVPANHIIGKAVFCN